MTKRSALPKSLTTVTTFSKIIALILFVLLPLAAFFIGTLYQQQLDKAENIQIISTPNPIK